MSGAVEADDAEGKVHRMMQILIAEKVDQLNRCVRLAQREGLSVNLGLSRVGGSPAHTEVTVTEVARPLAWARGPGA